MEHDSTTNLNHESNCLQRKLLPTNSRPFVQMSLEELSLVQDLSCWTNTKVRCIGYLVDAGPNLLLRSCAEASGQFEIKVDVSLMERIPPSGIVIQLFGEICLSEAKIPFIRGCLYRKFESVDLVRYNRAIDTINRYFPWNIDVNARKKNHHNDEGNLILEY